MEASKIITTLLEAGMSVFKEDIPQTKQTKQLKIYIEYACVVGYS